MTCPTFNLQIFFQEQPVDFYKLCLSFLQSKKLKHCNVYRMPRSMWNLRRRRKSWLVSDVSLSTHFSIFVQNCLTEHVSIPILTMEKPFHTLSGVTSYFSTIKRLFYSDANKLLPDNKCWVILTSIAVAGHSKNRSTIWERNRKEALQILSRGSSLEGGRQRKDELKSDRKQPTRSRWSIALEQFLNLEAYCMRVELPLCWAACSF